MPKLNLVDADLKIKGKDSKYDVFDPIRQKYVCLTPEEWVRQHFIHYLIQKKEVPVTLIAVEQSLKVNNMDRRADIVVYNNKLKPLLIVECKSYKVKITQSVFDQAARYNRELGVDFIAVTNGLQSYFCKIDKVNLRYIFVEELPMYKDMY